MARIGIDLGGTKIEIVALDARGAERLRRRVPTPSDSYEATLEAIAKLVHDADAELGGPSTVGIGTPGAISPATGLLRNSNSTALNGKRFRQDLERRLGRKVRLANDANCFALSEAIDGAATGAGVVFGVILGTGVGGGIVVRGRVLEGANHIAGEWGHNPLPWPRDDERPGHSCYCGKKGCIETFLSGPGLSTHHYKRCGERLDPRSIVDRATGGDAACDESLRLYEDRLARSLAHVINVLDPDVVVLGGGMSNVPRLYGSVPEIWTKYVFSDRVDTRLVQNRHGDSSGVRGAAWLWND
jgi:predicted NBD/HSP70 family sugar kinase